MTSNIAPLIDELGDLRARIRALEREEQLLREQILGLGAGEHPGTRWVANVKMQARSRVDIDALRTVHPHIAQECTVTTVIPTIFIKAEIRDSDP